MAWSLDAVQVFTTPGFKPFTRQYAFVQASGIPATIGRLNVNPPVYPTLAWVAFAQDGNMGRIQPLRAASHIIAADLPGWNQLAIWFAYPITLNVYGARWV